MLIITGLVGLTSYSEKPGAEGIVPTAWPSEAKISKASASHTLLVFLHPECSCSQATLGELDQILVHASKNLKTFAVFIRPSGWSDQQLKGRLWGRAKSIPGVEIYVDSDSTEGKRFGALTSGHTLLYDKNGRLLFSGGITGSRGHLGDNAGQGSLVELLENRTSVVSQTNVFGCQLFNAGIIARATQWLNR